ncbi:SDR family oxidoreductase [Paraburkholderia fungorum]|uniref:SDR family NAD(P)-dependent oxidoreductase n=1 Tax=Paraburkholderia fungorum TaxID=134537 RepID=UPI0038BCAFAD
MIKLTGKTALVTGASGSIGRSSALALSRAGAQVLIHYKHSDQDAQSLVAEIRTGGGNAQKVCADLSRSDGLHGLARRVRAIVGHRLDILVMNAGIWKAGSLEDTTVEDFDELMAVNVRAPYFLMQQLMPVMCKGTSVVLISSLAARTSIGSLPAHAASKGAADALVRYFAAKLGPRDVRVNAIAPGIVETTPSIFTNSAEGREFTLGIQALKRLAHPQDIESAVVFLASESARWITGATLRIDGGSRL